MFKVGDKVKCVNHEGSLGHLTEGMIYTVSAVDAKYVTLAEFHNSWGWFVSRFVKVPTVVTARRNDPATSKGKRKLSEYEQKVLAAMRSLAVSTNAGATCKEIAAKAGLPLNCVTPRIAPLRRAGLVATTDQRRDKQHVIFFTWEGWHNDSFN